MNTGHANHAQKVMKLAGSSPNQASDDRPDVVRPNPSLARRVSWASSLLTRAENPLGGDASVPVRGLIGDQFRLVIPGKTSTCPRMPRGNTQYASIHHTPAVIEVSKAMPGLRTTPDSQLLSPAAQLRYLGLAFIFRLFQDNFAAIKQPSSSVELMISTCWVTATKSALRAFLGHAARVSDRRPLPARCPVSQPG